MLNRKTTGPKRCHCAKAHDTWPNCSFDLLQECLNLEFCGQHQWGNLSCDLFHPHPLLRHPKRSWGKMPDKKPSPHPLQREDVAWNNLFFPLLLVTFLSYPTSAYMSLPYSKTYLGSSLLAKWDATQFMNPSIKPIRWRSNLLHWLFILQQRFCQISSC